MKRSFAQFVKRLGAVGLLKGVEDRALALHVSLQELYGGPNRAPSIVAARRAVYLWLMKEGKGNNEIARLFDRAPNSVWKLTRKKS
jgi:DNA-binding CsgD family transcriptional regulator